MKTKILLILTVAFLASCTVQEDRQIALQGDINNNFFGALDARAVENEDGSFSIQGTTQNQNLTLYLASPQQGTYNLGGNTTSYASYISENDVTYLTNPFGEGQAIITNWDSTNQTLTGRFDFTAVIPGVDTVKVSNGIFYKVPYGFQTLEDPIVDPDEDPATNAGTFAARVDGDSFTPFAVSAVNNDGSITITGTGASDSISLTIPDTAQQGSYQITDPGFAASYRVGTETESAISGQVTVIAHDVPNNNIKGTFSFLTENHSIALGQFNVIYEN